jgi:hypothetical protein
MKPKHQGESTMKTVTLLAVLLMSCQLCTGQPPENGDVCYVLNGGYNRVVYGLNTLDIWIRNDIELTGMSVGFEIEWDPTVTIIWDKHYGGYIPVKSWGDAIGIWNLAGVATLDDFLTFGNPVHFHMAAATIPGDGLPASTSSRFCYQLRFWCMGPPNTYIPIGFFVRPHVNLPTWKWMFAEWQNHYPPDVCGLPTVDEQGPLPHNIDFMIDFLNSPPIPGGDINCDGSVDIDDIVYFVQYIFGTGPPPKDPNNDGIPDC